MSDKITVRNTLNGRVARVRPVILNNPNLAKHLVVVEDDARDMNLARPTTAEEYSSRREDTPVIEPETPEIFTPEPEEEY